MILTTPLRAARAARPGPLRRPARAHRPGRPSRRPTQPTGQLDGDLRAARALRARGSRPGRAAGASRRRSSRWSRCAARRRTRSSGIGLVTGLAGTGDSVNMIAPASCRTCCSRTTSRSTRSSSRSKNVAIVLVEATLPPGIKPGRRIDVRVSTIGDAKSLVRAASLTLTELTDVTGSTVYATASGPDRRRRLPAGGEGASGAQNHRDGRHAPRRRQGRARGADGARQRPRLLYLDRARRTAPSATSCASPTRSTRSTRARPQAESDGRTVKVRVPEDLPESDARRLPRLDPRARDRARRPRARGRQRAHGRDRDGRRRAPAAAARSPTAT